MKLLRHPITTAIEYLLAFSFTVLYVVASAGPRYEEFLGLIFFTVSLGVGALFVSVSNPRPILNPVAFASLCFLGWTGCCWMLHREYGYTLAEIPAFDYGVNISAAAYLVLLGMNVLLAGSLQRIWEGQPPASAMPATKRQLLRERLHDGHKG